MLLQLPTDLEALIRKRLASGAYASAEEVIRRALEAQEAEAEDNWTEEERRSLDAKIDLALEQFASGETYGPEEARQKLATMRETHLANVSR